MTDSLQIASMLYLYLWLEPVAQCVSWTGVSVERGILKYMAMYHNGSVCRPLHICGRRCRNWTKERLLHGVVGTQTFIYRLTYSGKDINLQLMLMPIQWPPSPRNERLDQPEHMWVSVHPYDVTLLSRPHQDSNPRFTHPRPSPPESRIQHAITAKPMCPTSEVGDLWQVSSVRSVFVNESKYVVLFSFIDRISIRIDACQGRICYHFDRTIIIVIVTVVLARKLPFNCAISDALNEVLSCLFFRETKQI